MGKPHCVRASYMIQRAIEFSVTTLWIAARKSKGMQKPTASAFTVRKANIILVIFSTGLIPDDRLDKAKR
jgi:hypothetical protein